MQSLLLSMSGIYIHIPFCKKACHYCNFHFSTQLERKSQLVDSIVEEIQWRKDYLHDQNIHTIYLGGGTPSVLSEKELFKILNSVYKNFQVSGTVELTLEANPDDLDAEKLRSLRQLEVNRLSIGVQSFFEADLTYMNRSHNASQAESSLKRAQDHGFENISIDLIYGSPTTTDAMWKENVAKALSLSIPHLSCYALTVEPNTALAHFIKAKKTVAPDEDRSAQQFHHLIEATAANHYLHYEISNFALADQLSQHNTNYWRGVPYLGIGPAAHSFNGSSRQWNVSHNAHYMKHVEAHDSTSLFEVEKLSPEDQTNEYIMTSLRTMWGLDINQIASIEHQIKVKAAAQKYIERGLMILEEDKFIITKEGKFLADGIASDLFV